MGSLFTFALVFWMPPKTVFPQQGYTKKPNRGHVKLRMTPILIAPHRTPRRYQNRHRIIAIRIPAVKGSVYQALNRFITSSVSLNKTVIHKNEKQIWEYISQTQTSALQHHNSGFTYHKSATVKGGTAAALRPKALDGDMRVQSGLCFFFALILPNRERTEPIDKMLFAMLRTAVIAYEPITLSTRAPRSGVPAAIGCE